uniref:SR-related CTD-associated factor 4b n=1 Tax=Oncorhynchus kisutch TaxID=8019 RepID=A0A8C7K6G6_ONCKI
IIMDSVNAFNLELFSMIDMKPPISRAKMMSVTKSAIKAIKLYKHVVQIVEKFIKKCKPELKVPGLYVVDSIVRQSRHQFGVDKDVYGPRFQKNFTPTFQNLYLCPHDDKSKIIRVLNLWQKNAVFEMDVVQPLLDMAAGSIVPTPSPQEDLQAQPQVPSASIASVQTPVSSASIAAALPQVSRASIAAALPQLPPQLQNPEALAAVAQLFQSGQGHEVRKLLDRFDYDDEPEEVKREETNPLVPGNQYDGHFPGPMQPNMEQQFQGQPGRQQTPVGGYPGLNKGYSQSQHTDQGNSREREDPSGRREGRQRGHGRRSRSRSGSRSPRRKRSPGSPSRKPRHSSQRSGSRSRESRWNSPRSRSQERKEREKDKDRRQKGLPSIKSQTLSVCTTTLWVGQLDKKTSQQDVMCLLEEFGQIDSINMIPPRGCAYIVMVHRQDAYRALHKLGRGSFKVNQKAIKIAWALNKGIKATHKKFWDVERGVTYIPWSKVKIEELEGSREGGMLDADTLCPGKHLSHATSTPSALGESQLSCLIPHLLASFSKCIGEEDFWTEQRRRSGCHGNRGSCHRPCTGNTRYRGPNETQHRQQGPNESHHRQQGPNESHHRQQGPNESQHRQQGPNETQHRPQGPNESHHRPQGPNETHHRQQGPNESHHRQQGPNESHHRQQGPNESHHRQQGPNETQHRPQGPNESHHRPQGPNETHHRQQGPNETHHRQQGPNETHHRQQGPNETHHRQQGPNETHHRQQGPNETHHRLQGPNETHHRQQGPNETHHRQQGPNETHHRQQGPNETH